MDLISNPLDFERPLVELEKQLAVMRDEIASGNQGLTDQYAKLEQRAEKMRRDVYGKLTPFQRVQLSRHFDRPFALDYIKRIMTDFIEFHGDRYFRDDPAIVAGTAKFQNQRVVVVGHQRGRSTAERLERNFGMAQPEGYRKALRMFKMAEKFKMPIVTFIDTQGAYPGLEAEERGQARAIAHNLIELSMFKTPSVSIVIGEGGSGGALALGVTDRILMLENACYSVITPEGCASILWHGKNESTPLQHAAQAAEMLQVTADSLLKLKVIDEIIPEPLGGAHRDHQKTAERVRQVLSRQLDELLALSEAELLEQRYQKYRAMGEFTGEQ